MKRTLLNFWHGLQPRERWMVGGGGLFAVLLLSHQLVWQPWQNAIDYMEESVVNHRINLVWMQQQAEQLQSGNVQITRSAVRGQDQSLMAVIEQTSRAAGVRDSIQQLLPRENNTQVSVVLEQTSFNKWVTWADTLQNQYGVTIIQLDAEREEKPDQAEIRVTFSRG